MDLTPLGSMIGARVDGIDFASPAELVANGLSVDEVRKSIGADSLAYISLEELIEATTLPADKLCRACFDGVYPVALPEPEFLGKHLLEGIERSVTKEVEGLATLVVGGGASDALSRP